MCSSTALLRFVVLFNCQQDYAKPTGFHVTQWEGVEQNINLWCGSRSLSLKQDISFGALARPQSHSPRDKTARNHRSLRKSFSAHPVGRQLLLESLWNQLLNSQSCRYRYQFAFPWQPRPYGKCIFPYWLASGCWRLLTVLHKIGPKEMYNATLKTPFNCFGCK